MRNIVNTEAKKHTLKVIVIKQDPFIPSKGMRLSEMIGFSDSVELSYKEIAEDIEYSSHGLVKVKFVEIIDHNEFHRYKKELTLANGKKSFTMDEETLLEIFKDGWYGSWNHPILKAFNDDGGAFSCDYSYMIDKYDLCRRRNNGEFDQVWYANMDPPMGYESLMVGHGAYWINGAPIQRECELFPIINITITRRDANYECNAHMSENIIGRLHMKPTDSWYSAAYKENEFADIPYEEMNTWMKFVLTARNCGYDPKTGEGKLIPACGNVHFGPNSVTDYDWKNDTVVESSWRDWLENYPELKGTHEPTDYRAWVPEGKERDACRYHHRWWFSLFPHAAGMTAEGISHSWWDYLCGLDMIREVNPLHSVMKVELGEKLEIPYSVRYQSGKGDIIVVDAPAVNVHIAGDDIICPCDGELQVKAKGTAQISLYRDGRFGTVKVICE